MRAIRAWYDKLVARVTLFQNKKEDNFGILNILKIQPIFLGLSESEFKNLIKYISIESLTPQDIEKKTKINKQNLYLIIGGRLEAATRTSAESALSKFNEYSKDEILNLLSLANKESSVEIGKVLEPTTFLMLDLERFRKNRKYKSIHSVLLRNMTNYFSDRLLHTERVLINTSGIAMKSIDKQLEEEKIRVLFGMFVVRMIIILCVYTISLRGLEILKVDFGDPTVVSTSMLFIVSFFVYNAMMRTKLPLSEFGLSTVGWKRSVFEGVLFSVVLFLLMFLMKFTLIQILPQFKGLPVFEFNTGMDKNLHIISWKEFFIMIVYIIFAPVQEFLVRGGLQGSLYSFLMGTLNRRIWISIIVSNLIFVTFHTHISFLFSLSALLPGIGWGWLYSRHRTLIGVSISHVLVGISVVFILGITDIVGARVPQTPEMPTLESPISPDVK